MNLFIAQVNFGLLCALLRISVGTKAFRSFSGLAVTCSEGVVGVKGSILKVTSADV